jgi:hypothetical protein
MRKDAGWSLGPDEGRQIEVCFTFSRALPESKGSTLNEATSLFLFLVTAYYSGRFIMLSVITNIYNKKTKGPTLMELFTAREKLKTFFDN